MCTNLPTKKRADERTDADKEATMTKMRRRKKNVHRVSGQNDGSSGRFGGDDVPHAATRTRVDSAAWFVHQHARRTIKNRDRRR